MRTADSRPLTNHNEAPLEYWRNTGYSIDNVRKVGLAIDQQWMGALIEFCGNGNLNMVLTTRTWERQQGHYPAIAAFFNTLAKRPVLHDRRGAIMVCLEDGLWPELESHGRQAPVFSFGRHQNDTTSFIMADPAYLDSNGYEVDIEDLRAAERQIDFDEKKRTLFFRGAATGMFIEGSNWSSCHRGKLCSFSRDLNRPEILDAKLTRMKHLSETQQENLTNEGVVGDVIPFADFLRYRYLVHADGYCCSWTSLVTKLASNSLVVRMLSEYEQWYYRDLIPWKHYVPLRPDASDAPEIYEWLVNHDDEVKEIIQNANAFVRERLDFELVCSETEQLVASVLDLYHPSEKEGES